MSTIPYAASKRGVGLGVKVAAVAMAGLVGFAGVDKLTGWSPVHFGSVHVPVPHLPPLSHTTQGPTKIEIALQQVRNLHDLSVLSASYGWSEDVSSSHQTLGITTGHSRHHFAVSGSAIFSVDFDRAAFSSGPQSVTYYLPAPVPGPVAIDPTSVKEINSCSHDLGPAHISRSCGVDPVALEEQGQASMAKTAAADTARIDQARGDVTTLLACIVQPTGWTVSVAWDDQTKPPAAASCTKPLPQRLVPYAPTTTGAP